MSHLFVTSGKTPDGKQIVGFGSLNPYEKEGKEKAPTARDVFYKVDAIDGFLKAVDADRIPLTLKGKDNEGKDLFMKADAFYTQGTAQSGVAYGVNKISIEIGEERLYASKFSGQETYAFDNAEKNKDLIAKFNKSIEKGVDITLSATKEETLSKYPKLIDTIKQIDKSAYVEIDYVKGQGAVLKGVSKEKPAKEQEAQDPEKKNVVNKKFEPSKGKEKETADIAR